MVVVFSSAVHLFDVWFVGIDFMLVRGLSFSGRLNPRAMFVCGFCSVAVEREETRRLFALAFPTEITSVH